jgi:hypothetical protein
VSDRGLVPTEGRPAISAGSGRKVRDRIEDFLRARPVRMLNSRRVAQSHSPLIFEARPCLAVRLARQK